MPPRSGDAPPRDDGAGPRRPRLASIRAGARARTKGLRGGVRRADVGRQPWLLGIIGALWAVVIGLAVAALPLLVTWMASPDSGLTWIESLRIAGLIWVLANGAPIALQAVSYSLVPLGLTLVPLLLLGYAGGWAARRSRAASVRQVSLVVLPAALAYAAAVGVVAATTAEPASRISVLPAVVAALLLSLVALGWGAVRSSGLLPTLGLPRWLTTSVRAGLVAASMVIGLGAVAATTSLILHIDDAITMAQSLGAGIGGGLALLVLGAAYVPVMAVWGSAYVMGAGVVIGPAVTVSPFLAVTAPTDLPPFPLLAALPQETTPLAWLLPLTGIVAGVVAGLLIARRARDEARLVRLAMAGGAAVAAGAVLALGAFLASGSLGDGRLAQVGPVPLTVGILGAVLVVLGAAPSAVVPRPPMRPPLAVANPHDEMLPTDTVPEDAEERTIDG